MGAFVLPLKFNWFLSQAPRNPIPNQAQPVQKRKGKKAKKMEDPVVSYSSRYSDNLFFKSGKVMMMNLSFHSVNDYHDNFFDELFSQLGTKESFHRNSTPFPREWLKLPVSPFLRTMKGCYQRNRYSIWWRNLHSGHIRASSAITSARNTWGLMWVMTVGMKNASLHSAHSLATLVREFEEWR